MSDASKKTALLRATITVVARGGLRALTTRAVAEEAGVSHGLVRHHFGGRDALIEQAMEYAVTESLTRSNMAGDDATPSQLAPSEPTPNESTPSAMTLGDFAAGIESLAQRDEELQAFQYELLLESRRRPELRPVTDRYLTRYREAITARLAALGVADARASRIAWLALDATVFHELIAPGDAKANLDALRDLLATYSQPGAPPQP